jgi:hypothetical protein
VSGPKRHGLGPQTHLSASTQSRARPCPAVNRWQPIHALASHTALPLQVGTATPYPGHLTTVPFGVAGCALVYTCAMPCLWEFRHSPTHPSTPRPTDRPPTGRDYDHTHTPIEDTNNDCETPCCLPTTSAARLQHPASGRTIRAMDRPASARSRAGSCNWFVRGFSFALFNG